MNEQKDLKTSSDGRKYTGMPIGNEHHWDYTNCEWHEKKISPDMWKIRMTSIKKKQTPTTHMGNIEPNTEYHWYIIADQKVRKIDENTYETSLEGIKHKIGHKRPYWKDYSYTYNDQIKAGRSENQLKLAALTAELKTQERIIKNQPTEQEKKETK